MGEDLDPLTTGSNSQAFSHRGILGMMFSVAVAGALLGFVFQGMLFGLGILFGGVLAWVNYHWLDRSTRRLFDNTTAASAGWLSLKYVLRYVAIGAVLLLVYMTGIFPITAVIAGLGAFAVAVVIHGFKDIFKS